MDQIMEGMTVTVHFTGSLEQWILGSNIRPDDRVRSMLRHEMRVETRTVRFVWLNGFATEDDVYIADCNIPRVGEEWVRNQLEIKRLVLAPVEYLFAINKKRPELQHRFALAAGTDENIAALFSNELFTRSIHGNWHGTVCLLALDSRL